MKAIDELRELAQEVVDQCRNALTASSGTFAASLPSEIAEAKCKLLIAKLGKSAAHWNDAVGRHAGLVTTEKSSPDATFPRHRVFKLMGTAQTIKDALEKGQLRTIREAVQAELFVDLTEQAEHLHGRGYYLAAAVIMRAVLEERLRLLCAKEQCRVGKAKPGIEDLNQALYRLSEASLEPMYTKSTMQRVTAMAGIGNDAAHNKRPIEEQDSQSFLRDLKDFLDRFEA